MIKYFSLFSGIGGFELGIDKAILSKQRQEKLDSLQHKRNCPNTNDSLSIGIAQESQSVNTQNMGCVGFSEIDRYAIQIYKNHFNHRGYGNVQEINWSDVEDFELLVGGFPCQAFSIAGKRRGFGDTRGTLFFEIARAAQEKQPRLLLLENVKGLLSHDQGETFGVILNTLDELGYDLQWQVLNSKNFGVPQNRERVFIVGHLRGTGRPEVFPIGQANEIHPEDDNRKIAKCLDSNYHKGWLDHGQRTMIAPCMRAEHHNTADVHFITDYRNKNDMKICPTLLGNDHNTIHRVDNIRRLTPTECERLQGFPDNWTEGISDTQRYKCLGNAVTVNVIEAIVEKLYA